MSQYITKIKTTSGDLQIDYNALANLPEADTTLSESGKFADSKIVGDSISNLSALIGDKPTSEQISTAVANKADVNHTHNIVDIDSLSDELNSKYEKPSGGITKEDMSTNVQSALNKAETAIQSLSGYATESYVDTKVAGIVDVSPDTLNTLNELAAALGDDPNFATTIAAQIGGKVDKIDGKVLSSNDYTNYEKTKLSGIEEGANNTVVDSAFSETSINPVQNKVVNAAISGLRTLVGDTSVSTQISDAIKDKSDTGHTHNYAGSSSAGGAAYSANKINTNAGSNTQPVYFANGIPVNTTYTLGASVPADAKFTDTTYSAATTSADGLMSAADKAKLDGIANGANKTTLSSLGVTATAAELNYVDGVTSNIQTQLNSKEASGAASTALTNAKSYTDSRIEAMVGDTQVSSQISGAIASKQDTITGGATTIVSSNLTANTVLVSNANGKVSASAITVTELGCLDGVTSSIQAQLDDKAASSHGTHVSFSTTAPIVAGTASVGSANTVSRSDHVHPAQTTVSGNAGSATKLATSRTVRTNLASTSTASFDGSADITPGVNGTLPVGNGGTGYNSITDTTYTTARYRASSLHSSATTPSANGVIAWVYG